MASRGKNGRPSSLPPLTPEEVRREQQAARQRRYLAKKAEHGLVSITMLVPADAHAVLRKIEAATRANPMAHKAAAGLLAPIAEQLAALNGAQRRGRTSNPVTPIGALNARHEGADNRVNRASGKAPSERQLQLAARFGIPPRDISADSGLLAQWIDQQRRG